MSIYSPEPEKSLWDKIPTPVSFIVGTILFVCLAHPLILICVVAAGFVLGTICFMAKEAVIYMIPPARWAMKVPRRLWKCFIRTIGEDYDDSFY